MAFWDDFKAGLEQAIADEYRYPSRLAAAAEVEQGSLSRFLTGKSGLGAETLGRLADKLGARIVFPGQGGPTTRDVCWVDAKVVSVENGVRPVAENYVAVPLVGEAGAGPGMIGQEQLKSWVLLYRHHHSVQFRSNLLAVELGEGQDSMVPTLHPKDIVLVDRDEFKPLDNGRGIYLVREPQWDGGAKVKRVKVQRRDSQAMLIFYSDNAETNPPELYDLEADYGGDIRRAIIGRAVWAWSDLTRK